MNDDQLDAIFAKARSAPPETGGLEFGFETRLMAQIRGMQSESEGWLGWSWRLTPWFAALAVCVLGAGLLVLPEIESVLDLGSEHYVAMVEYFTGESL